MRLIGQRPLSFACSCSQARVEDTLRGLGEAETLAASQDGLTEVHCDFCGQGYRFSDEEVRSLFESTGANAPGSELLQ